MNQQSTLEQLQELKLSGMAKRYEAILNQPVHVYSSQADPLFQHTDPSDQDCYLKHIPAC